VSSSWAPATIVSIVEGDGEVRALPKVLHRIAAELGVFLLTPNDPSRIPRGRLIADGGIEREVSAAAIRVTGLGGILVLIDADDDCPAEYGPHLLARATKTRPDKKISVVLAKHEFEAWFLAAAPSIAGKHGFPEELASPQDPENPRGCKEWLSRARTSTGGRPYRETVDQALLASTFDMSMARSNSPSFDKFYREITRLLGL
jgi:hypothetical protein